VTGINLDSSYAPAILYDVDGFGQTTDDVIQPKFRS